MRHQRALDDGEKNERRQHILKSAAALFETTSYDQLSMLAVARSSGLAKGTVYLYFNTKEELFLALVDDAFGRWFAELQQRLETLPAGSDSPVHIAAFASSISESLQQHGILHTVLEYNIPFAAALAFKQHLRDHLLRTGEQIENCFAFLCKGQGAELLLQAYAALIGLQSMNNPSEVVRTILQQPEMSVLVIDGNAGLRQMVSRLLMGLSIENERKK